MLGLDRLIGDAAGGGHAGDAGDGLARVAGNARGLGEGSARVGLDDPEIDRGCARDRQRIDDEPAIDADHRQHDAEQQAEADAGQQEAEEVVADVAIGEVHFADLRRDAGSHAARPS